MIAQAANSLPAVPLFLLEFIGRNVASGCFSPRVAGKLGQSLHDTQVTQIMTLKS